MFIFFFFFFQAEDGIRDRDVTGVQTCALPICRGDGVDAAGRAGGAVVVDVAAVRACAAGGEARAVGGAGATADDLAAVAHGPGDADGGGGRCGFESRDRGGGRSGSPGGWSGPQPGREVHELVAAGDGVDPDLWLRKGQVAGCLLCQDLRSHGWSAVGQPRDPGGAIGAVPSGPLPGAGCLTGWRRDFRPDAPERLRRIYLGDRPRARPATGGGPGAARSATGGDLDSGARSVRCDGDVVSSCRRGSEQKNGEHQYEGDRVRDYALPHTATACATCVTSHWPSMRVRVAFAM